MKIAIDGPAGAGKSTVAKALARTLDILYLDTGAMYRAVALKMLRCGLTPQEEDRVAEVLKELDFDVRYEDGRQTLYLDGEEVSALIRTPEVSAGASAFSALGCVRAYLVEMQRAIARKQDCVLDGRDIGTCVLPDADFKFFLTASCEERARRRTLEMREKGEEADEKAILASIIERDRNDSTRAISPLRQAEDALLVDSSSMNADEVIAFMLAKIRGEA